MKFEGYKLGFRFNALHKTEATDAKPHRHTFEITLFLRRDSDKMVAYDVAEAPIQEILDRYSGKILNEIYPFNEISPTVENISTFLYGEFSRALEKTGSTMDRFELSDSPQHTYVIDAGDLTDAQREAIRRVVPESDTQNTVATHVPAPQKQATVAIPVGTPENRRPAPVYLLGAAASRWYTPLSLLILAAISVILTLAVWKSGLYPLGFDIHGHLFKAQVLLDAIKDGNFYPLYSEYWYNGIQLFRYWPALPYYFLALLAFLTGGIMRGYLAFLAASYFIGGAGWIFLSRKINRPKLGLFLAAAWFFLPDNVRVFFGEGNYPRMFITMLLPWLFSFLWLFVCYRKKKFLLPLVLTMLAIVFSHLMIAAMVGVGTALFLLFYAIFNRRAKESLFALAGMLAAFAVAGTWVYPALVGGITAMDSSGTSDLMASLSAALKDSLNPFARLDDGIADLYFGLSIALISLIGIFASKSKNRSGFVVMVLIILGTTTAITPLLQELPLSQLFWIRRFAPIAYACFIIALLEWKTLRKPLLGIMCAALALDCVPTMNLSVMETHMNIPATESEIAQSMDAYLFSDAQELTKQRVSLMDLSTLGPMPSYGFCMLDSKTKYVFGWAWQGASTAQNISYLNESLENKNYDYLFDRSVELGADTVLMEKSRISGETDRDNLLYAASLSGYSLAEENDKMLLFSLNVSGSFGVQTTYTGLAIGTTAALVPGILPSYHPGDKLMIDDYSVEELEQYDRIYLSGFFYDDKETAEALVRQVAADGVQVYIDMNRIPADPLTSRMTFLDVSAQPVTFYDRYPELITPTRTAQAMDFPEGYETWNTVYLTGLSESYGYAWFEDTKLDFAGKGEDENITFIGFNILFHAYTAGDTEVKSVLNDMMALDENTLPEREIVPISVAYGNDTITIVSPTDNVNTTIAWQDIFESEQDIWDENNFLVVNKGTTVITMRYPYLSRGTAISIAGSVAELLIFLALYGKLRNPFRKKIRQ